MRQYLFVSIFNTISAPQKIFKSNKNVLNLEKQPQFIKTIHKNMSEIHRTLETGQHGVCKKTALVYKISQFGVKNPAAVVAQARARAARAASTGRHPAPPWGGFLRGVRATHFICIYPCCAVTRNEERLFCDSGTVKSVFCSRTHVSLLFFYQSLSYF